MVSSLNLVKFDVKCDADNKYFHKKVQAGFDMDFDHVKVLPDQYKYFLMVASSNIMFGFTMSDQTDSFDNWFELDSPAAGPGHSTHFRDYRFYELQSSFRCLHPSILFYSQVNRTNNTCHLTRQEDGKPREVPEGDNSCKLCASPHGIQYYLQLASDKSSLRRLDRSKILHGFNQMHLRIVSMVSHTETVKSRANVYLRGQLRTLRFGFAGLKKLVLDFDKYFPYELSRVDPANADGLEIQIKSHKSSRFVYPKALRSTSVFGGFVSKRHNGEHVLSLFLVQKSRNVLLSNVFQSASAADSGKGLAGDSVFSRNKTVFRHAGFEYQISKYKQVSQNPEAGETGEAQKYSSYVQMLRAMLDQISMGVFPKSQNESRRDTLGGLADFDEPGYKFKQASKVVRTGPQTSQPECNSLAEQGLFAKKSNIMELGLTAGSPFRPDKNRI